MPDLAASRLLLFARNLLRAGDFAELLSITREEVQASIGYQHAWLMVADDEAVEELRLLHFSGDQASTAWSVAPVLKVGGDALLEALRASDVPVVVEDARLDPRTDKRLVQQLRCRTLINVPLRLLDRPFGLLGVGTFGDEGCRAPTVEQLAHLVGMASQLVVAAGRLRFAELREQARNDKLILERRLMQLQRLESLGTLAGVMAHEFDDLLTVVLANASLLAEGLAGGAPRAKIERDIEAIALAGGRARELTRKLLTMSRQQDLRLTPQDLNQRLGELVTVLQHTLPKDITVDLIRGANLPFCDGDATQLNQAFMNLFLNARDAMPGGGRLTIETGQVLVDGAYARMHPSARPGRYLLVTVTDTGVGMSAEVMERIFEPFFTTKTDHTRGGLGLSLAFGIVRQHGGMLQCHSERGVGSSFKVYLPIAGRPDGAAGAAPRAGGRERILLAEEDDGVRTVAVSVLERAGYRVLAVADGDAAIAAAAREAFDLAILPVVTPRLRCRQVIERLRAAQPGARLLLASGNASGRNVFDWLNYAGLQLLRTPYDPDQLLMAVRQALDQGTVVEPSGAGRW